MTKKGDGRLFFDGPPPARRGLRKKVSVPFAEVDL
jgi:hypothetical protein